MGPVLGHHQRCRLRQVEDLSGPIVIAHGLSQRLTASGAGARKLINGEVGLGYLTQGFPRMTRLAASLLVR
jgi:hypothetical protein